MENAGSDAMLAPTEFRSKDKDPEQGLVEFDLYIEFEISSLQPTRKMPVTGPRLQSCKLLVDLTWWTRWRSQVELS